MGGLLFIEWELGNIGSGSFASWYRDLTSLALCVLLVIWGLVGSITEAVSIGLGSLETDSEIKIFTQLFC